MIKDMLTKNLPWAAPVVAIGLAASGVFDRGENAEPQQVQSTANVAAPAAAVVQPQPAQVAATTSVVTDENEVSQTSNLATSFNSLTAAGVLDQSVVTEPAQPTQVAAVEPAPAAPRQPSLDDDPAGFFAAAQAKLAAKTSCYEDLRNLTEQARVYFPSGGLTGGERGMGQARLIGLVAQECPGVQIIVEGHSDPSGDPDVNLRLSRQRAEAIVARVAASGINTSNFIVKGMGQSVPSTVRGPKPASFYDRRVEFDVVQTRVSATLNSAAPRPLAPCVAQLKDAVSQVKVFYAPRSITSSASDMQAALNLAIKASACPQARLRVVGQHTDQEGAGETPATGRLRAAALMSALVGQGIESTQVIIAAPSWSQTDPDQPGLSSSRIDFDVIVDEG
ncbi:putative lipoprotein YiaD [Ascidiaceihabitans donghaensis]|uniref:Putative lipoprotein YiaD n=2 Tax=Ascidiaceihabitans donghaensis TaxID=1510460 RepID=A0A2R8BE18_9RHOB|nr:putative lipoprotein YiaD [Ascidiaceihabitans donghaensis]